MSSWVRIPTKVITLFLWEKTAQSSISVLDLSVQWLDVLRTLEQWSHWAIAARILWYLTIILNKDKMQFHHGYITDNSGVLQWQQRDHAVVFQWQHWSVTMTIHKCKSGLTVMSQWQHSDHAIDFQWQHCSVTMTMHERNSGLTVMSQWLHSDHAEVQ